MLLSMTAAHWMVTKEWILELTYIAEYFETVRGVIVNECGDGVPYDVVSPRLAWAPRRMNRTAVVSVALHGSERPSSFQSKYGTMCTTKSI